MQSDKEAKSLIFASLLCLAPQAALIQPDKVKLASVLHFLAFQRLME
ncbi:hypothetical protein [Peribacillus asahii]|uniref:Uncharacterized protein n=1 Tax=Peribacillus asahii TaxID=228899 RepID=A0A3T0KVB0_9BACI|nr:hypothetical protein [Peribacillus asahii]AZV44154.1 hypothetical protein BAOM_3545 [Peribacillus asahii]USK83872.1 hypothetical protein LIT35_15680 [Peribacillus asahii]